MKVKLCGLADTKRLAKKLAKKARAGDIILLHGDLGAGKTTFTKYFVEALKIKTDVGNMRALQSQTASFGGMCQDADVKKMLQDLADEFKYSDPVSSEATKEMETELKFLVNEIQRALVDGDIKSVEGFLVRAKAGLAERNRICRLGK